MATLRDLAAEAFQTAPAGSRPVAAPGDYWVVLVGEAGPVSAVSTDTTLVDGARPPGVLVAAADLDQADAFESDAFAGFADVTALVLTEPDEAGEPRVVGVVNGLTLARAMLRGPVRGLSGPVLPGPPAIPILARSCGYLEGGTTCATPMSFVARPSLLPDCPNQRALAPHQFSW